MNAEKKEEAPSLFSAGTIFPRRVWEPTETGWASREPTREDHERRRVVLEWFQTRKQER